MRALRTGFVIGRVFLRRHARPSTRQGHGVPRQRLPGDRHLVHRRSGLGVVSKPAREEKLLEQGKTRVAIWDTKVALRRVETVFDRYFWGSYWQPGRTFQEVMGDLTGTPLEKSLEVLKNNVCCWIGRLPTVGTGSITRGNCPTWPRKWPGSATSWTFATPRPTPRQCRDTSRVRGAGVHLDRTLEEF